MPDNDDLGDRIVKAALVMSFPFLFPLRSGLGELFPTLGGFERVIRVGGTAVAAQGFPLTRGGAGVQGAILKEILEEQQLEAAARVGRFLRE